MLYWVYEYIPDSTSNRYAEWSNRVPGSVERNLHKLINQNLPA